jgi:hypothetical protein
MMKRLAYNSKMLIHKRLRKEYRAAITTSCLKDNCCLRLNGIPSGTRVTVLDGDEYRTIRRCVGKLCDLLIFITRPELIALVAEMKSGGFHATQVAEQIQSCAREIEIVSKPEVIKKFIPLLVHQVVKHPTELKVLQSKKIRFNGANYPVIRTKCNDSLQSLLNKYT